MVTLHVSVWVEMFVCRSWLCTLWSRSTWACELKLYTGDSAGGEARHAPRERVSWNDKIISNTKKYKVTLHVSVWVEMLRRKLQDFHQWSRSTWACELKCAINDVIFTEPMVTLHVSVWVEISNALDSFVFMTVTLHVSVWVEMCHYFVLLGHCRVTLHVSVWVEIISKK